MSNSIQYLKHLLLSKNRKVTSLDVDFLNRILDSEDVSENPSNPEKYMVRFALNRAKMRQESVINVGKETIGSKQLIETLFTLDQENKIDFYNIENRDYRGTCFVIDDRIVGFEFIKKTGSISIPGLKNID